MPDLLSDVLSRLSIKGALYFRTAFTPPWGIEVPSFERVCRFHFVHRGECEIQVLASGERMKFHQGDLAIVPHGMSHVLSSVPADSVSVLPLEQFVEESGYSGRGVLVYEGDNREKSDHETQLICGHISFETGAKHLILDRLPGLIRISNYGEAAGRWMDSTLRMIADETSGARIGGDLIALKMSEVVFAQAIRGFIEGEEGDQAGLSGFADPKLARALDAFHNQPAESWTPENLAQVAGLSRTAFSQQFSAKIGVTPIQYLTTWRMQIAKQCLVHQNASVTDAAEIVGYASESAFARVFKKEVGMTPAAYRADGQAKL